MEREPPGAEAFRNEFFQRQRLLQGKDPGRRGGRWGGSVRFLGLPQPSAPNRVAKTAELYFSHFRLKSEIEVPRTPLSQRLLRASLPASVDAGNPQDSLAGPRVTALTFSGVLSESVPSQGIPRCLSQSPSSWRTPVILELGLHSAPA